MATDEIELTGKGLIQDCHFCGENKWQPSMCFVADALNRLLPKEEDSWYYWVCLNCTASTPKAGTRAGSIVMANLRRGEKK